MYDDEYFTFFFHNLPLWPGSIGNGSVIWSAEKQRWRKKLSGRKRDRKEEWNLRPLILVLAAIRFPSWLENSALLSQVQGQWRRPELFSSSVVSVELSRGKTDGERRGCCCSVRSGPAGLGVGCGVDVFWAVLKRRRRSGNWRMCVLEAFKTHVHDISWYFRRLFDESSPSKLERTRLCTLLSLCGFCRHSWNLGGFLRVDVAVLVRGGIS